MSRLEALEQVAEAARAWRRTAAKIDGVLLDDALRALDALPQPQPPGEAVEALAAEVAALRAQMDNVIWRLDQRQ
jgi:hypothetical protein